MDMGCPGRDMVVRVEKVKEAKVGEGCPSRTVQQLFRAPRIVESE
jgi:hypothetical protein